MIVGMNRHLLFSTLGLLSFAAGLAVYGEEGPLIPALSATPQASVPTVPQNGDVNPYGVAFVPDGFPYGGILRPGDVLVSNFNNSSNAQGTGTTIVSVSTEFNASLFFQGPTGLGLTTALAVLKNGYVLAGNLPSPMGSCAGASFTGVSQGSLLVINRFGQQVADLTSSVFLNGPWDMTVLDNGDFAQVFVSDVLSGTVTRLDLVVPATDADNAPRIPVLATQIGSGYLHRCDPNALVVGPTGLALDPLRGTLYVASTGDNAIYAIDNAERSFRDGGTGRLIYQDNAHLRGPVGLMLAPNGDLVATNGDAVNGDPNHPSELVEFTTSGQFVAQRSVDPAQGAAFGLAVATVGNIFVFATVDDSTNVLDIWKVKP